MISFRLTDEEYERFRRLCVARGLRNVSELVRTAVNQMLLTSEEGPSKHQAELDFRVGRLESQVADLVNVLHHLELRLNQDGGGFSFVAAT